ncbi:trans-sialidase, putative [Trypanosoma brucei gambiense DAL972]|uniref:Trans-sialidase, putative n=2 Tax=Trypanosoma brucei TaxID=5691 RepID=C9ZJM5_TRYB9|nr:trans-sialidase, putative [Trypanosoma brucei gambiense DAL972]RHW74019.1 Enriched in surface-labeled proteome protein 1 [Trypanosoma brucei equiperdum]CBH09584.1 trans-sialidase, putative [Trypanosoma brucei gambiense DAL972]|eukprot:XP_011771889.1 trans-sialidase, putative [Trypanosoma brucei gambiense DAL972]
MRVVYRRFFPVLLVLLSLEHLCSRHACADEGEEGGVNHTVGGNLTGTHSYRSPSLLSIGDSLVTVSETWDPSDTEQYVDVITEYSAHYGAPAVTQVAVRNDTLDFHAVYKHKEDRESTMHPTAVAIDGMIFVLIFCKNIGASGNQTGDAVIMPHVAKGVVLPGGATGNVWVNWTQLMPIRSLLPKVIEGKRVSMFFGGGGNTIVMTKGTLVMPVQMVRTDDQRFATIIYSSNNGTSWTVAKGFTDSGCRESSVLIWKRKMLLVARSDDGYTKVFESDYMGDVWTESLGTISRVLGNSPDRRGPGNQGSAITIPLGNETVMFFTQTTVSNSSDSNEGDINRIDQRIWFSDGSRMVKVGHIYWNDHLSSSRSYLLYSNNRLLCAYEMGAEKAYAITVRSLVGELENARFARETWARQDAYISGICSSAKESAPCASGVPVDGLVGLLSSMVNGTAWVDAYFSVNANFVGGLAGPAGLTFEGTARGGRWPVGVQGQNQRFHFANTHFTLVLTLTIHEQTAPRAPVLVTRLYENGSYIDLEFSYTDDKRWHIQYGAEYGSTSGQWALNQEHQLAFVLRGGTIAVYLDGKRMPTMARMLAGNGNLLNITHFYIGGYGTVKQSPRDRLTIRNAMLYNRPLKKAEIDKLFAAKSGITAATKGIEPLTPKWNHKTKDLEPQSGDGRADHAFRTPSWALPLFVLHLYSLFM